MSPHTITTLFVSPTVLPALRPRLPSLIAAPRRPPALSRHTHISLSAAPFDLDNVPSAPSISRTVSQPRSSAAAPTPLAQPCDSALYDVAVVGAGPAGLSLSAALCRRGISVVVLDGAIDEPWPNHYGVWLDEFRAVELDDCATAVYPTTAVYAGPQKITLDREYLRVDRVMLKSRLLDRCIEGGARLRRALVGDVRHVSESESEVLFGPSTREKSADHGFCDFEDVQGECALRARLVVDCTGHSLRFTETEPGSRFRAPWEQAAYGIEAEVESHPYQADQMLLMDFRDDHMQESERWRKVSDERPTFLYVFPTGSKRAFFEETSVIAPTAVPFEELKERLFRRLAFDGVKVTRIIEEERSLIPLGGSLPSRAQRVIGFGGAASLVHPATGYMVARTVSMADTVAATIAEGLQPGEGSRKEFSAMAVSEAVWKVTWSLALRRQRDFLGFGAELLMALDMDESRRFFDAFFALPQPMWSKFLCFNLDTPFDRTHFALYFFVIASGPIRWSLLKGIVEIGRWRLIRSVLPLWASAFDDS